MSGNPQLGVLCKLPLFLADVKVQGGETPADLTPAEARGVLWQASRGRFLIDAPGAARFLVVDGNSISVDCKPEASPEIVARFLRMAPMAALLYQRGVLACHASAAATPRGAVLISGVSGAGKSTLAAALLKRGCRLLADEIVPVELDREGWPVVRPTGPELGLWPDAAQRLFPDGMPEWLENTGVSPRAYVAAKWDPATAVPLCGIVHLATRPASKPEEEIDTPIARFEIAARMSWNSRIADILLDSGECLRLSAALARRIPVRRVLRSTVRWEAEETADRILNHWT